MDRQGLINSSPESRRRFAELEKQRQALLIACMATLSVCLGVEITPERISLYQEPLADLTEIQIRRAFALARREYRPYGGSYPSPGEIRAYGMRDEEKLLNDAPAVLSWKKPVDWDPVQRAAEAAEIIAKSNLRVFPAERSRRRSSWTADETRLEEDDAS